VIFVVLTAIASPDFLLNLVALANFMRLSLLKGAHAALPVLRGRKSGFAPEVAVCAAALNDRILSGAGTKSP
jgi:hypothetical protein